MTVSTLLLIIATIGATSFVSGLFGMVGGMILSGILLVLLPVPTAMLVHGAAQIASNSWRTFLWRGHVNWTIVLPHVLGSLIAVAVWSAFLYVPSRPVALILLGVSPFIALTLPTRYRLNADNRFHVIVNAILCMSLMLTTGVAGPLLDSFFINGKLDRRAVIATKGVCQVVGHGLKMAYFGSFINANHEVDSLLLAIAVIVPMLGTLAAKRLLERMSDSQFRRWTNLLIVTVSGYYVLHGGYLWVQTVI